jgi:thiol-disulfide isomerase/thioredoxin
MAPIVHGLEAEYFRAIDFVYLDIDDLENSDFLKELGFRYQPQFVLLDGEGNILKQWLGPVAAKDFRDVFDLYVH